MFFVLMLFVGALLKSAYDLDGSIGYLFSEENLWKAVKALVFASIAILGGWFWLKNVK